MLGAQRSLASSYLAEVFESQYPVHLLYEIFPKRTLQNLMPSKGRPLIMPLIIGFENASLRAQRRRPGKGKVGWEGRRGEREGSKEEMGNPVRLLPRGVEVFRCVRRHRHGHRETLTLSLTHTHFL